MMMLRMLLIQLLWFFFSGGTHGFVIDNRVTRSQLGFSGYSSSSALSLTIDEHAAKARVSPVAQFGVGDVPESLVRIFRSSSEARTSVHQRRHGGGQPCDSFPTSNLTRPQINCPRSRRNDISSLRSGRMGRETVPNEDLSSVQQRVCGGLQREV